MKSIAENSRMLALAAAWALLPVSNLAGSAMNDLAFQNTSFAIDLYQKIRGQEGNLFFSPYSISTALGMTCAGARGQTAAEMAKVLHFVLPAPALHEAFGDLAARVAEVEAKKQVTFSVANSLWADKDYPFIEAYLNLCRTRYQAEARLVDFAKASEASRREINSWVEKQTQDRIKDLLHDGDVTPLTRLVLCDAIYFKGNWATPFDPKSTQPAPFFLAPDKSVDVSTMHRQAPFKAMKSGALSLIDLPYAGGDLSMVILLPEAKDGLGEIERQLLSDSFHQRGGPRLQGVAAPTKPPADQALFAQISALESARVPA